MTQPIRPFADINSSVTEQSNMFQFPPTEETFAWNKVDEDEDEDNTGLPSGD
jgi:hypothetical protein